LTFFFDRNIAIRLVHMVNGFETTHTVIHLDDDKRFKHTSKDVFIIKTLSKENPMPVFLTCDLNMRSKYPEERKALQNSGLTVIFFRKTFDKLSIHKQSIKMMVAWEQIVPAVAECRQPTAFEVSQNGKLRLLGPTQNL